MSEHQLFNMMGHILLLFLWQRYSQLKLSLESYCNKYEIMAISLNGFKKELGKFMEDDVWQWLWTISKTENEYLGVSTQGFSTSQKLAIVLYYLIV